MKKLLPMICLFVFALVACAPAEVETNRNSSDFARGQVISTRGFLVSDIAGGLGKTFKAKLIFELNKRGFTAIDTSLGSSAKADYELVGEVKADKKTVDLGTVNGMPQTISDGSFVLRDVRVQVVDRKNKLLARAYDLDLRSSSITLSDVARMFAERMKIDFKPVL
jgi:hypothetical protein